MFNKSKLVKLALLAIIFFFVVMVGGCNLVKMNPEAEKQQIVAEVGEESITKEQFNYYFALTVLNGKVQGQELPTDAEQVNEIKSQVLDGVVEDRLMLQLAKTEGIPVDEEKANTQANEWMELLQTDIGGEEEYNNFLAENDMTAEGFLAFLKEIDLNNQYITGLYEKLTKDEVVSDEEIAKYYNENSKLFDPSTVEAKHILSETKEQADKIVERAKAGEDFDELMEEFKEVEGIREAADLGEFKYTAMVPEFSEAAFKLEEGKISDAVQTEFGFHVIKVEKKSEKEVEKLEDVKESINQQLLQNQQYEVYQAFIEEKTKEVEINKYPENL